MSPARRAARHANAFAVELLPGLAHAVRTEVLVPHTMDLTAQLGIPLSTCRRPAQVALTTLLFVVSRWGDLQLPADRRDSKTIFVIVDVSHHHLRRRSSSAWAKYAE